MNVSSISNFSYRPLSFKGNDKKSNPIENKSESLQNNGPEVKISPETYMAMYVGSAFDKLEDEGIIDIDYDGSIEMTDYFDGDGEYFESDEFAADMALTALKVASAQLGASEPMAKTVPTFVKFEYKNYIALFEKSLEETKALLQQMSLPDVDELPSMDEIVENEELCTPETFAKMALANLPEMIEKQENMLRLYKTTMANQLKETLQECAKAQNYMFQKAINHGFEGNARAVVEDLTASFELYNEPKITDNEDGTLTYLYSDMLGNSYTVVRNKENGDYISANTKSVDSSKGFELEFNPNGSIKRLDYLNSIDKSLVSISQKGNKVVAKQIFNDVVTERVFVKTEDGTIKLNSARIYPKESV